MTCFCLDRVVRVDFSQLVQSFRTSLWVNLTVNVRIADVSLRILRIHCHTLTIPCSSLTTIVLHCIDVAFQNVSVTIVLELSDDSISNGISLIIALVHCKKVTQSYQCLRILFELLLVFLDFLGKSLRICITSLQCSLYRFQHVLIVDILCHCRCCQTHDEQTCY